jgi:NADH-quinone oxidoreductase subunit J
VDPINWHSFFFLLFGGAACAFALAVVFSPNIVHMAMYLVVSLGAVAGLFFLAGADFVGAMQLLMYVGGTVVLLAFGVMLTAHKPFITLRIRGGEWILAAVVGGSLLVLLLQAALSVENWRAPADPKAGEQVTATRIGGALVGYRVDRLDAMAQEAADPTAIERSRGMAGYLLPFEIIGIHLLVVLVAAAYLARTKRAAGNAQSPAATSQ